MIQQTNNNLTMFMAELANDNYYNNAQSLVRVKLSQGHSTKYIDLPLVSTHEFPNPTIHYVLILATENILEDLSDVILPGDSRLNNIPGYTTNTRLSSTISKAFCWLVSRRIKNNVSNYNVGHTGNFNTDSNSIDDKDNIRYSLSPGLNKSYTTTVDQYKGNINNDNIGIFMTDNSIVLKSAGGSIILGPDGISLLGPRTETMTTGTFGVMQKNPLGTIIPETMMTFPAAIKYIPNLDMIASIGNTVNRMVKLSEAMGTVTSAVSNLTR